jgi:riboflavin kinase/FMN adenylyltransferase
MLTHPYRIRGMVTHGDARGAKIGYPTANLSAVDTLLPGPAVYAGRASFAGWEYPAAINVGANPTFGQHETKVEVHLLDFEGSLYGQPLEVDFLTRLRTIQAFPNVEALKAQLARDTAAVRRLARELPGPMDGASDKPET